MQVTYPRIGSAQIAQNFQSTISGIVVYEEIMHIRCPLSVWEEHFRTLAGQPSSGETFMGRLLHSLIFYDAPPYVFTVGYFTFGALVLATFLFCRPRWPFSGKHLPPVHHPA